MRERQWGRIVNVASSSVREPIPAPHPLQRAPDGDRRVPEDARRGGRRRRHHREHGRHRAVRDRPARLQLGIVGGDGAKRRSGGSGRAGWASRRSSGTWSRSSCSERAAFLTGTVIPLDGGMLRASVYDGVDRDTARRRGHARHVRRRLAGASVRRHAADRARAERRHRRRGGDPRRAAGVGGADGRSPRGSDPDRSRVRGVLPAGADAGAAPPRRSRAGAGAPSGGGRRGARALGAFVHRRARDRARLRGQHGDGAARVPRGRGARLRRRAQHGELRAEPVRRSQAGGAVAADRCGGAGAGRGGGQRRSRSPTARSGTSSRSTRGSSSTSAGPTCCPRRTIDHGSWARVGLTVAGFLFVYAISQIAHV